MSHLYRQLLVTGHCITLGWWCWCIHDGTSPLIWTQYTGDPHWAAARPSTDCSLLAACVYSGRVHCTLYTVHCTPVHCTLYTVHLASSHLEPAHTWAHCPHTREHCVIWSSSHQLSHECHPVQCNSLHCMLKLNI